MIRISKKNLVYLFLIFPFFQPGIFSLLQSLKIIDVIYDLWRCISIFIIIILFCTVCKIDKLLFFVFLYFSWILFSTLFKQGSLVSFFSQCGSIAALCLLISMCHRKGDMQNLLKTIIGLLEFYLIINAITVFIYAPQGGIVSDIESIRMKTNNYFLGYDNQHVYYILPYLALSLIYDKFYCEVIKWRTIIFHIIINVAVLICWSADTVVAVVVFYLLLITNKNKYINKLINSYTVIAVNYIIFYFLVILTMSSRLSALMEYILQKNIGSAREWIWANYLFYFYKSPIIGNGYLDIASRFSLTYASHAHNMYLDILFVSGIVGLLLFTIIIFLTTNSGKDILSESQKILIIAIIAYMVAFQATANPYCPTFYLLLMLSYEAGSYDKYCANAVKG